MTQQITHYKQQKPMRQRGRKGTLSVADQLLLTMLYLRQYHTFLQLGELFDISESYAQKRYTFMVKMMLQALDLPDEKALTGEHLTLLLDVTEQEIERPVKKQRSFFSGKKTAYDQNPAPRLLVDGCHPGGAGGERPQTRL
ncbi:MAG TPA: transposase family protein [Blastocatellia bacterium]|nr:transposase family protein [Blastocatellia bacterium]